MSNEKEENNKATKENDLAVDFGADVALSIAEEGQSSAHNMSSKEKEERERQSGSLEGGQNHTELRQNEAIETNPKPEKETQETIANDIKKMPSRRDDEDDPGRSEAKEEEIAEEMPSYPSKLPNGISENLELEQSCKDGIDTKIAPSQQAKKEHKLSLAGPNPFPGFTESGRLKEPPKREAGSGKNRKDGTALAYAPPTSYVPPDDAAPSRNKPYPSNPSSRAAHSSEMKKIRKASFAEEASMELPSNSSTAKLDGSKKKQAHGCKAGKKSAHVAPAPSTLHAPPDDTPPYSQAKKFEEEKREETLSNIREEIRPGPVRVRGMNWDGNEESDNYMDFSSEKIAAVDTVGKNRTHSTEFLAEAHTVVEPVLVTAKRETFFRRNQWWIVGGGVVIIVAIIAVVLATTLTTSDQPTQAPTFGVDDRIRMLIQDELSTAAISEESLSWVVEQRVAKGDASYSNQRLLTQYALVALYLSTSNEDIEFVKNYRIVEANDECSWYGVSCKDGIVTEIEITENERSGTIPPALGILSSGLSNLNLSSSKLTGSLPSELFALTQLTTIDLSANDLTGGIPSTIGQATSLSVLQLSENQLSSTLPPEIGKVTSLKSVSLAHNRMSGSIPSDIEYLSALQELDVRNNKFAYELPSEMGHLTSLTGLFFAAQ